VLIGDFNAVEKNPAVAFLRGREVSLAGQPQSWASPLVETFDHLHPNATERNTLNLWRDNRTGTLKIDHILVSTDARILSAHIRNHDQPLVSDHFPVLARVIFP
jgi:endonuclease/exonuclease/phosphatase family metal-dependent hydrolase